MARRRAGFGEDTAMRGVDIAQGYRSRNPYFDAPWASRTIEPYKSYGLSQNLGSYRGASDTSLYNQSAAAVIKMAGLKPGGGGGAPDPTPTPPGPPTPPPPPAPPAPPRPPKPPKKGPRPAKPKSGKGTGKGGGTRPRPAPSPPARPHRPPRGETEGDEPGARGSHSHKIPKAPKKPKPKAPPRPRKKAPLPPKRPAGRGELE